MAKVELRAPNTTVVFLTRRSEHLLGGREGEDKRCISRGDAGALGGIAAGGKGAAAPAIQGSLQESERCVRQIGTDANVAQAASSDGFILSGRSSPGAGASVVSHA